MARKRQPGTGDKLTAEQVRELAGRLVNTTWNVYAIARAQFGPDCRPGDEVFDQLYKQCGLARCIECNVWQDSSDFPTAGPESPTVCIDCVADSGHELGGEG